ncbi:MAG: UDP-glucose 6-dehydrogenase [Phycisphaerae bacterium]
MRITIIGTGYVGLVTAVCLADQGNEVVAQDQDRRKMDLLKGGECPIYEPGLVELIRSNLSGGRLQFTSDFAEALGHGEVVFIAVGTPSLPDGRPDLGALHSVADQLADLVDGPRIVVIKSTVPVGTGDDLEARINRRARHRVTVVNVPEFLKEGSAVDDFLRPDRVVIGAQDPAAAAVLRELHDPFVRNQRPIYVMSRKAAELTKYAANTYLATRISFINQIAALCDALGIDVNEVRLGMGSDTRIGFQFLYPGAGYGGSCLPKDVAAMIHINRQAGVNADLFESVAAVNDRQREALFGKIVRRFGEVLSGRVFAVWGAAFKPKTDDVREAPALRLIELLLAAGARVRAHDPKALENLEKHFGDRLEYCPRGYEALDGADALVIVTEWNEFRTPNFTEIARRLKQPIIFDGRNLYSLESMRGRGFEYYSIGRPAVDA